MILLKVNIVDVFNLDGSPVFPIQDLIINERYVIHIDGNQVQIPNLDSFIGDKGLYIDIVEMCLGNSLVMSFHQLSRIDNNPIFFISSMEIKIQMMIKN